MLYENKINLNTLIFILSKDILITNFIIYYNLKINIILLACEFMDFLTFIVYIVLFVILMIFVFSIGMLKPFMRKKEMALVLISAFFIGSLGGAFFLSPIYEDVPEMMSNFEKVVPSNEETMDLMFSSSLDIDELEKNLTETDGVESFTTTGITFQMWRFDDNEYAYFQSVIPNIDSHYENYTVNQSGKIDIDIERGYDTSSALKSFSDWYTEVYGGSISYAQIQAEVVLKSSALDTVEENLLARGIVATNIEGPVQDSIENTNSSMLSNTEFILCSGVVGVIVSICGVYCDNIVVAFRKFKKFLNAKVKR